VGYSPVYWLAPVELEYYYRLMVLGWMGLGFEEEKDSMIDWAEMVAQVGWIDLE